LLFLSDFTGFIALRLHQKYYQKIVQQSVLFFAGNGAFPFSKKLFLRKSYRYFITSVLLLVTISKFFIVYYLKEYRIQEATTVMPSLGTSEAIELKNLFETRNDYGYRF
jgi:putative colanic acid biosynthesis UDP-glucose lipid carrier transferase